MDSVRNNNFCLGDEFKVDLLQELYNIMSGPECDSCFESEKETNVSFNLSNVDSEDCYLDSIRYNAFEEFRRNGIEQELDEVDVFQSRLRERTRPVQEPKNPVVTECMKQERKSKKKKMDQVVFCVFCKNNNEQPKVYSSHTLKDSEGRTTCPILRKYTCPICGVKGGDKAHTIRYCPKNVDRNFSPGLGNLMSSPHLSTGKRNPRCSQ